MTSFLKDKKLPKVLVISSVDPSIGPAIVGLEHYMALKQAGYDVDFMTKYPVEGHPEFISVYDKYPKPSFASRVYNYACSRLHLSFKVRQAPDYHFFYKKEITPPVPVKKVVDRVEKSYDVVYILFWQELLSFATIEALYDKLRCQFQFRCVDYSPMSGGCHFTGECLRYQTGCGHCPAIYSQKDRDFTSWNVQYRKRVYEKVKPVVYGNTYMNSFYRKSYLLGGYERLEVVLPVMDNDTYRPQDMEASRRHFAICSEKDFLLFFGSQSLTDERKGVKYLLEALAIFYQRLNDSERRRVLLVLAGRDITPIEEQLCFDYKYLGYVNPSELPAVYSMSNVFLCPSVNDAGPTMVNQSMSCGTPVVAFEMGTALDVVKGRGTGYCAKLRDSEDFAKGIEMLFRMTEPEYLNLRHRCREVALELTSAEAFAQNFYRVYRKYK